MSPRSLNFIVAALASAALATAPFGAAEAWTNGGAQSVTSGGKPGCAGVATGKPTTVNSSINIYKPTTVNKSINIYKPTTINKEINVYKPVTIDKNIDITKNIDASKNITINKNITIDKSIVINKGGGSAEAFAQAMAQASASASASASVTNNVFYGGYTDYVTVNNRAGSTISAIQTSKQCEMQEANVVKAIHAVCLSADGREFPASHMTGDTWISTSSESEILRCIPGSHLKVTIGDVLQSDQGMAGTYASGQVLECADHEALRHFKDGMLKCAPAVPVPDCTERTNLRRYGTGDMFFSYRASVCVGATSAARESHELELTGMSLEGGVGEGGN